MKFSLKYSLTAIGIQVLLFIVMIIIVRISGHDSVLAPLIYLYSPIIILIGALGNLKGEAAMAAIPLAILVGILIYGIVIGIIFSSLKGRKMT